MSTCEGKDCDASAKAVKRSPESDAEEDSPLKKPCLSMEVKADESSDKVREEAEKTTVESSPKSTDLKYEYLDHTADIQIHSWGNSLEEAFEQGVVAMFGYQTDLEYVETGRTETVEAEGEDMLSLLFHLLDEFLFLFCADPFFVPKEVKIVEFDRENWRIVAEGRGETFDLSKHTQGTEVKAITYSNMQIHDNKDTHDCYFILDI